MGFISAQYTQPIASNTRQKYLYFASNGSFAHKKHYVRDNTTPTSPTVKTSPPQTCLHYLLSPLQRLVTAIWRQICRAVAPWVETEQRFNKRVGPNINNESILKGYVPDIGLVRERGNKGLQIPLNYRQNSAEARFRMEQAMNNGSYNNPQAYKQAMQEAHDISYRGYSGNNYYYEKNGQLLKINGGKIRGPGVLKNYYPLEADRVVVVGRDYNATYIGAQRRGYKNQLDLEGIPNDAQPVNVEDVHFYPDGKYMDLYFKRMQQTGKEVLTLIQSGAPHQPIVAKIAKHYQYAANARPFEQINNSLFMNEVNLMLRRAGLHEIPHGILDHAAQRLQPQAFQQYFINYVEQFNPGLRDSKVAA
ncbi:MAG: hypothetical protein QE263_05360 [Vampirovibrionales bacterium]|nr:hypothetical protein [Vampirovibrionales bacterium]